MLEKIGYLVRDKKIDGITGISDESNKQGMRAVIELRRDQQPDVVLNKLYSQTQIQTVFGINMVAIDNSRQMLYFKRNTPAFLNHRQEVVYRRTV